MTGYVGNPALPKPVRGSVQEKELLQYDFTPEQYGALVKLTATLCKVFPKIKCDYPRDANGHLVPRKLPDDELEKYQGVLGHYHIQTNKVDPGPAFQWESVEGQAPGLIRREADGPSRRAEAGSPRPS